MSYAEFIEKNIFDSLQMKNSFVLRPEIMKEKKVAYSYRRDKKAFTKQAEYYNEDKQLKELVLIDGDKHIYSTTEDLLKWDQSLYIKKLVSNSTLQEAFTSGKLNNGVKTNYGFGWEMDDVLYIYHTGAIENYKTLISRDTLTKTTVVILLNNGERDGQLGDLFMIAHHILNNEAYTLPKQCKIEKKSYKIFRQNYWIKYN
jgi:CubicO group peptidase (beta-lactamase class C family)